MNLIDIVTNPIIAMKIRTRIVDFFRDSIAAIPPIVWMYNAYHPIPRYVRFINAILALWALLGSNIVNVMNYPHTGIIAIICVPVILATSIYHICYAFTERPILSSYYHFLLTVAGSAAYTIVYILAISPILPVHIFIISVVVPQLVWIYGRIYPLHQAIRIGNLILGTIPVIASMFILLEPLKEAPLARSILLWSAIIATGAIICNEIYWTATKSNIIPSRIATITLYTVGICLHTIHMYIFTSVIIMLMLHNRIEDIKDFMEFVYP